MTTVQYDIPRDPHASSGMRTPARIGVVLADLGRLRVAALEYLILHLNTLQPHVEFELLDATNDPLVARLKPNARIEWSSCEQDMVGLVLRLRKARDEINAQYDLSETWPPHIVIVSLAKLSNQYYLANIGAVTGIFLGDWQRYMAPPSLLEFILTLLIRDALFVISPRNEGGQSHIGTKGCVGDFNDRLVNVRYKALQAFLCSYCRDIARRNGVEHEALDLVAVLKKDWLGSSSDPHSPAGIVHKLGYDLFCTKGAAPTIWEQTKSSLREEWVKTLLGFAAAVLVAILLFRLGIKQ